jgi:vacuolar-type H+-ATPase subunit E/Vma4
MNNRSFITDDEIDKALDYLRDNARDAAQAKANRVYLEEYRKVLKAQLMKEHGKLSAVLQEREAYSDPRYSDHLEAIRQAVEIDEGHRFLRAAADAKIEAWRTQSSNTRARV